jgi:hypothetical protein
MLFKGKMQVAAVDAERHEDAIQAGLGGAVSNSLPTPVALG